MSKSRIRFGPILVALLVISGLGCASEQPLYSASAAELTEQKSAFDEGLEHYNLKRFHAASECFVRAVNQDPRNQKHHYYLALCLEQLKDYDGAKDEYNIAYQLNPFSLEGGCARDAVVKVAGRKAELSHPADDVQTYEQASREITRQTQEVQGRHLNDARHESAFQSNLGLLEARNAEMDRRAIRYTVRGNRGSMVVNEAQQKARFMIIDSMTQSRLTMAQGYRAAAETQLSSNLLKQLMSEPVKPGKPHLRALGTNLYVRNYSQFDDELPPADPPMELRATAHSFSELPVELHAKSISLDDLSKDKTVGVR